MANIQGKYTLRAAIYTGGDPESRDLYTYTNGDRSANISFSQSCDLDFSQLDPENPANIGYSRCFISKATSHILRARIVTPGSPGVQPALGSLAANILLTAYALDADNNRHEGSSWNLKLDHYNEWQTLNLKFKTFGLKSISDHFYFTILGQGPSYLTVDDYNLQSAYEGETLRAFLEIEIDTAGMMSTTDFSLV